MNNEYDLFGRQIVIYLNMNQLFTNNLFIKINISVVYIPIPIKVKSKIKLVKLKRKISNIKSNTIKFLLK